MSKHLNIDDMIQRLLSARKNSDQFVDLEEEELIELCTLTKNILIRQPILLELGVPVNICGDIHGQFIDLLRLFDLVGSPDEKNYLFLGDYVDRGVRSTETISLLYAYKVKYPERFFLLRGNHEDASLNRVYGFYEECDYRYSVKVWEAFVESFKYLPLAAIIRNKIFCCHGGLSPELILNQIREIPRPVEKINKGLVCDLLWSDPNRNIQGWAESPRGISVIFGEDKVEEFLSKNNFDLMCRAHQVVEDGYEFFANRKLVTIFSAPNYCGQFDNAGAVMCVDSSLTCSFKILKPKTQENVLWALP